MISILVSTIDEGIKRVKNVLLEPRDDVEYIVSHQYTSDRYREIPDELKRRDVTISQIKGKGVSRSRNNAIKHASGEIGLFADDDVTYRNSYIDIVKETFRENTDIDIALFKIKTRTGEPEYKEYPEARLELKKTSFSISSVEIGFNIEKIKNAGLYFDERFGAGRELIVGAEETVFIEDCLKHGLKVLYVPEYIVEHPFLSTIKSVPKFDKRRNWVTGAYDCRTNGSIALFKAFGGTLKILPTLLRHGINPFSYLYHRLSAALYILRTNKKYMAVEDDSVIYPSKRSRPTSRSEHKVSALDV
ncbi:Glycosyl transferase family 2 [Fodinibius roseus]|uniref:Glycosyl transferase family 2 n=1 Tax=Fodinibius roseus TaxID=1194090 RepID=A0A1M4ST97_9BACT|nr:glycosyltransferase family A protein [Fodinibius roseus]SHE35416.1 Glycosyl transferase family 2 [Fodinibius roseus]